jgi:hypothetical protein
MQLYITKCTCTTTLVIAFITFSIQTPHKKYLNPEITFLNTEFDQWAENNIKIIILYYLSLLLVHMFTTKCTYVSILCIFRLSI